MIWRSWSCGSVSGLLMEPLKLLAIMDIRARSISFTSRPRRPYGHLITNPLAKPFSISSFLFSTDPAGKPILAFGIKLSRQRSL